MVVALLVVGAMSLLCTGLAGGYCHVLRTTKRLIVPIPR
jgi:hypothetical protein